MTSFRKRTMISILMILIVTINSSGCTNKRVGEQASEYPTKIPSPPTFEDEIQKQIQDMSLEQKIGQLLMPAFRQGQYEGVDSYIEPMKNAIREYHIGGVILFKENIKTKEQVQLLISQLQEESALPLFIAVDEEGGVVSRIASNPEMGFSPIQSAFEIGKTKDVEIAYNVGKELANMLVELGFNMNFAPVVDIWSNPENTVIGTRSFGTEPEIVSRMGAEVMRGLQEGNIVSAAKHFPGHGDTSEDTHTERAFVNRSLKELEERELIPFYHMIQNGVEGIMVAHIEVSQIDEGIPASLSHKMITELLREEMRFNGLVITDALDMHAITSQFEPGEAALKSFLAGADILLMPDIEPSYHRLLKAYEDNIISDERLNESLYKIIKIKLENDIWKKHIPEVS